MIGSKNFLVYVLEHFEKQPIYYRMFKGMGNSSQTHVEIYLILGLPL